MILVDYSQIAHSSFFAMIKNVSLTEINEDFLRHIILNSIRSIRSKFKNEYGQLVIATDSPNSWRKDVFPYYKASRKEAREASPYDWSFIHSVFDKVKNELNEYFPYKVLSVARAEADDIIGTLAAEFGDQDKVLVVSADKDFFQLCQYSNVRQYDPIREKWIEGNYSEYLFQHIMKGDSGDGIPNVFSSPDSFVNKIRQKPVYQRKLDEWKNQDISEFLTEEQQKNYRRNEILIDLRKTPQDIKDKIIDAFYAAPDKANDLNSYFIKYRLANLYSSIGDF